MIRAFDEELYIAYSPTASTRLGRDLWVVTKAFNYWVDDEHRIHIPAGYLTDGASVPKMFQKLLPAWGPYGQAAVIHDWLCEYLRVWNEFHSDFVPITRSKCDNYFNEAMRDIGVSNTTRRVMWNAVRIYGHVYSVVNQQHNTDKHDMTDYLVNHHQVTGMWI